MLYLLFATPLISPFNLPIHVWNLVPIGLFWFHHGYVVINWKFSRKARLHHNNLIVSTITTNIVKVNDVIEQEEELMGCKQGRHAKLFNDSYPCSLNWLRYDETTGMYQTNKQCLLLSLNLFNLDIISQRWHTLWAIPCHWKKETAIAQGTLSYCKDKTIEYEIYWFTDSVVLSVCWAKYRAGHFFESFSSEP